MEVDRKFSGFIIGAIILTGIVGFFVGVNPDSFFQNELQSIQNPHDLQPLQLGAVVTAEAYHADGTLYYKIEDHNVLEPSFVSSIASCFSGVDTSPGNWADCNLVADQMTILMDNQDGSGDSQFTVSTVNAVLPEGCNTGSDCTGWEIVALFDFINEVCTPTVNCYDVTLAASQNQNSGGINHVEFPAPIPVGPGDRLEVTMTWDITE